MRKVRGLQGKVPEVNFLHGLPPPRAPLAPPGSKVILELVPFGRKSVSHEASFQPLLQQGAARKTMRKEPGCVPGSEHVLLPAAAYPIERNKVCVCVWGG